MAHGLRTVTPSLVVAQHNAARTSGVVRQHARREQFPEDRMCLFRLDVSAGGAKRICAFWRGGHCASRPPFTEVHAHGCLETCRACADDVDCAPRRLGERPRDG